MKQMFIFVEIYYTRCISHRQQARIELFEMKTEQILMYFFCFYVGLGRYLAVVQVHPILYNLFPFALKIIIAVLLQPPPFPFGSHVLYVVKYPQQRKNPSNRHITSVFEIQYFFFFTTAIPAPLKTGGKRQSKMLHLIYQN